LKKWPYLTTLIGNRFSFGVWGEALFASFHELFGPGIAGSWSDAFPSAEITDGYLPPESFQGDADFLL
jgi:hypothetical protein